MSRKERILATLKCRINDRTTDCEQQKKSLIGFLKRLQEEARIYVEILEEGESLVPLEKLPRDQGRWSLGVVTEEMDKCVQFNQNWAREFQHMQEAMYQLKLAEACFETAETNKKGSQI